MEGFDFVSDVKNIIIQEMHSDTYVKSLLSEVSVHGPENLTATIDWCR